MKATQIVPQHPQSIEETQLQTWFERDRAWVSLQTLDGETILEWWDEAVSEAIEDGFLEPRRYHESAFEYAQSLRLVGGCAVTLARTIELLTELLEENANPHSTLEGVLDRETVEAIGIAQNFLRRLRYDNMPSDADLLAEPSVSYWLKDAIRQSTNRDVCDAYSDAMTLANVLLRRVDTAMQNLGCPSKDGAR